MTTVFVDQPMLLPESGKKKKQEEKKRKKKQEETGRNRNKQ